MAEPETLIDTCCLVNLCAVDAPEQILSQIPLRWYLARSVEGEEISVRPRADAGRNERRRIDLAPCVSSGILLRCEPDSPQEQELYVKLARDVDDGEAMPLAIACIRKWAVATDDAAARTLARKLGVVTLSTPQVLRRWAEYAAVPAETISEAIGRIETLARFVPNVQLPEADWWAKYRPKSGP